MSKKIQVLFATVLFIMVLIVNNYIFDSKGYRIENWELIHNNQVELVEAPFSKTIESTGIYYLRSDFERMDVNALILPHVNCYAFKVYLNGKLIEETGDFNNPTANIWNYTHIISFDKDTLEDNNELVIEMFALHDVGLIITPSLDKSENVYLQVELQNFISNGFILIIIGISLSIGMVLIFLFLCNKKGKLTYLYNGIASILFCVYCLDSTYRITTGNIYNFLTIRKITVLAIYVAVYFIVVALRILLLKKYKRIKSVLIIEILLITIGLFQKDFIGFHKYISFMNIVMVAVILYLIYILYREEKGKFYFSATFFILTSVYTIIVLFLGIPAIITNFYAGFFVYLINLIINISKDFMNIEIDNIELGEIVIKDKLTGLYNRKMLETIEYCNKDILIFIDIDKFKNYNDTYGHQNGDELLKDIAVVFMNNINKSDKVIRYGGDEIIVYFKECTETEALDKIKKIQDKIILLCNEIDISYGIVKYKNNIFHTLTEADNMMYEMKKNKRNCR